MNTLKTRVCSLIALALLACCLTANAQAGGQILTVQKAEETYLTPEQYKELAVVPAANLVEYDLGCTSTLPLSADPSVITHWTTGSEASTARIIGTAPSDPIGSAVLLNDVILGSQSDVSVTVTALLIGTGGAATTIEVIATIDAKVSEDGEVPVIGQLDLVPGQRKRVSVVSAIRTLDTGRAIRVGFRSTGSATSFDICEVGLKVVVVTPAV